MEQRETGAVGVGAPRRLQGRTAFLSDDLEQANRGVRLHEQIALAGGSIKHGKLTVEKSPEALEHWLAAAS